VTVFKKMFHLMLLMTARKMKGWLLSANKKKTRLMKLPIFVG
jgi:hypothetical protein